MNRYQLLLIIIIAIILNGCTKKITIKMIEPAEINRATDTKRIIVTKFQNDKVTLDKKIESILSKYKIDGKKFFTIVSRDNTDQIIKEQKFQNSGIIDSNTIVDAGNLLGAEAIISGSVGDATLSDTIFYESRSRCEDKKCKKMIYYQVECMRRVVGLSAEIKMISIEKGDIIHADSMKKDLSYVHCSDDSLPIPSKITITQNISSYFANKFTYKLTPHYKYLSVELLDDGDLEYSDFQEKLLNDALVYIEHHRYDKAEKLLITLIDSTNEQSYVAFYNLGLLKEIKSEYLKAKEYYKKADDLTTQPVEAIDKAYIRINSTIKKYKLAQQQIYK
jgi:tetratricopeptide (TPR) repeat protein